MQPACPEPGPTTCPPARGAGAKRRLYYWHLARRRLEGEDWQVGRAGGRACRWELLKRMHAAGLPRTRGLAAGLCLTRRLCPPASPSCPPPLQTADGVHVHADPPMLQVLPLWTYPVCSALCSATASVLTHPIDVVKTRLQVLSNRAGSGSSGQRLTAWQVGAPGGCSWGGPGSAIALLLCWVDSCSGAAAAAWARRPPCSTV